MQIQELNVYTIVYYQDKVLLLKRKSDLWEFPGGGVDFGEDPIKAAERELKEETALTAKNLSLVGVTSAVFEKDGNKKHAIYLIYEGKVENDRVFISKEHSAYRWLTSSEISFMKLGLNAEFALDFL